MHQPVEETDLHVFAHHHMKYDAFMSREDCGCVWLMPLNAWWAHSLDWPGWYVIG